MTDQVAKYIKPADAEEYVRSAVQTFLGDPPESDFQRGFLCALLVLAKEAFGDRMNVPPYTEAYALCTQSTEHLGESCHDPSEACH